MRNIKETTTGTITVLKIILLKFSVDANDSAKKSANDSGVCGVQAGVVVTWLMRHIS